LKRAISGICLLDKPAGVTSNTALQRVRRAFGARKAGHTGSLDPLATGVLPICLGEATKMSAFLLDADKRYQVTARFGVTTDTGDADGALLAQTPVAELSRERLAPAIEALSGEIGQVPPMYSALKHNGRRLHEIARAGEYVEREPRPVTVFRFELLGVHADQAQFAVHCSKGTYVRALMESLGEALGVGAHVTALRRTAVAPFGEAPELITVPALERRVAEAGPQGVDDLLHGSDLALADRPAVTLTDGQARAAGHGQSVVGPAGVQPGAETRLYDAAGCFLGVAIGTKAGWLAPRRMLAG